MEEASNTLRPFSINTTGADMTLELLASKMESGDIEIPDFQRSHVWQMPKASRLIESFLLGLPVPQIFLYQDPQTQKLLVVDGQQRLLAIRYFIKGVYKGREFRLTGVNETWNDRTFDDLSESDQRRFKNITLRATIFQQVDPQDNQSVLEVFERLNTGGMALSPQEVRNAVIAGDFNQLAKDLNVKAQWKLLINKKSDDDRQRDIEMIVRILSLLDNYRQYKKPMNVFLNNSLIKNKKMSDIEKQRLADIFDKTIDIVVQSIGVMAFRPQSTVVLSVAESVFIGIATNSQSNSLTTDIKTAYHSLLKDPGFIGATKQHTTDVDNVQKRIGIAINAFKI